MELTTDNILNAKAYMRDYKNEIENHKADLGFIGRFFEKLFGTDFYSNLEMRLLNIYDMKWIQAYEILVRSNNKDKIYEL